MFGPISRLLKFTSRYGMVGHGWIQSTSTSSENARIASSSASSTCRGNHRCRMFSAASYLPAVILTGVMDRVIWNHRIDRNVGLPGSADYGGAARGTRFGRLVRGEHSRARGRSPRSSSPSRTSTPPKSPSPGSFTTEPGRHSEANRHAWLASLARACDPDYSSLSAELSAAAPLRPTLVRAPTEPSSRIDSCTSPAPGAMPRTTSRSKRIELLLNTLFAHPYPLPPLPP